MQHRCLLIGCGGISNAWLNAVKPMKDVEMVGFVDLNREAAQAKANEFNPSAFVGNDVVQAIEQTGATVVFDCTVPGAHTAIDCAALEAGCHVLCEKPLATSIPDAQKVIRTAAKTGNTHAVMQNRRYNPWIRAYRALIASGQISRLTTLTADFYIGAHFDGFRVEMEHVLLLDMAIHTFDAARLLCGARPVSVSCTEWNPAGSWFSHGANAIAAFTMDNGAVVSYRGSWTAQGLATSWESSWRAIGVDGSATWDGNEGIRCEQIAEDEGFIRPTREVVADSPPELTYTGHAGCIRDFLDAVETGRSPETVSGDNIYSLAMSLGAIESAEQRTTITIEELS